MARKSFVTENVAPLEPIVVELGGYRYRSTEDGGFEIDPESPRWAESFTFRPNIAAALDHLSASVAIKDGEQVSDRFSILKFYRDGLRPESLTRFDAIVNDEAREVDLVQLAEAMMWVTEQAAKRPTGR